MYVDAHIHLYAEEYDGIRDEVLKRAAENDVDLILSVAEDSETSLQNLDLLNRYRERYRIYIGIGIHPYTAINNPDDLERVVDLIAQHHDSIICIGEVGLDRKYNNSMKMWDKQVEAFETMIQLSKDLLKPLNIHSRRAARDVLTLLRKHDVREAYFHWYTDDEETLKEIVEEDLEEDTEIHRDSPPHPGTNRVRRTGPLLRPTREQDGRADTYTAHSREAGPALRGRPHRGHNHDTGELQETIQDPVWIRIKTREQLNIDIADDETDLP